MWRFIIAIAIVFLIVQPAAALQQGRGGGPKPKPTVPHSSTPAGTARGSQATKAHAPAPKPVKQSTHPQGKTPNAGATRTHTNSKPAAAAAKSSTPGNTKKATVSAPTTTSGNTKKTTAPAATTSSGDTKTTTVSAATTTSTGTLTPVQQKLQRNTNLAAKLQSRLPSGTNLMTAAADFRNLGQFVAAVNVSNNLGISFTQLKTKMVDEGLSLGQAIQSTKPTANATVEADRAERDARVIIAETETTTSKKVKKPSGVSGTSR